MGSSLASAESATPAQRTFASAKAAAEALVSAAETFDVAALKAILGPEGIDLVVTEDHRPGQEPGDGVRRDQAREKLEVVTDPKNAKNATLIIGDDEWPMPIPIVKAGSAGASTPRPGRQEILYRRIGRNELDAIQVCRGFVEAQDEYAAQRHDGSRVNQYAQRSSAPRESRTGWPGRTRTEPGAGR